MEQACQRTVPFSFRENVLSAVKAAGDFLYGDEKRTSRSVTFSYICLFSYLVISVYFSGNVACSM